MTAEMIMVSTWVTDSLFVWILLELLELGLYFYLILGILPGIKNMGKIDKIILRTVFLAMAVLIGIKYRIGTTFSHLSFSYNLLVLILGTGAAVRENFLLTAGIAVTYTSSGFSDLIQDQEFRHIQTDQGVSESSSTGGNRAFCSGTGVSESFGIRFSISSCRYPCREFYTSGQPVKSADICSPWSRRRSSVSQEQKYPNGK